MTEQGGRGRTRSDLVRKEPMRSEVKEKEMERMESDGWRGDLSSDERMTDGKWKEKKKRRGWDYKNGFHLHRNVLTWTIRQVKCGCSKCLTN